MREQESNVKIVQARYSILVTRLWLLASGSMVGTEAGPTVMSYIKIISRAGLCARNIRFRT